MTKKELNKILKRYEDKTYNKKDILNCHRSGIYKITQCSTGKVYIGQSIDIKTRLDQHIDSTKNGKLDPILNKNTVVDFKFEVLYVLNTDDPEILNKLEAYYIDYYKSNDNDLGFNSTIGNHIKNENNKTKNNIKECNARTVPYKLSRKIIKFVRNKCLFDLEHIYNKKILVITPFDYLLPILVEHNNNVTVLSSIRSSKVLQDITDIEDFKNNYRIIYKDESEMIEELCKMNKFDIIIMNPPYDTGLGNKIIAKSTEMAKEVISLNPKKLLKTEKNYTHVKDIEAVDCKIFEDASIGDGLVICRLVNGYNNNKSWEEVNALGMKKEYHDFALLNIKGKKNYNYHNSPSINIKLSLNPRTDFICGAKTAANYHLAYNQACFDYLWNVTKVLTEKGLKIDSKGGLTSYNCICFNSELEHNNFTKFAFANNCGKTGHNTFNELLIMAGSVRSIGDAIPNIDWSKDRDYENCTLEDLMNWIKEDNNIK